MSSFSLLSLSLSCTVHCRKRKMDHGILKDPSTSSNTYWQIERESNQCSGEPLTWGERCRIRHMPTRLYLAVVKRDMFKVLHCWFNERIPTDAHCFHTHKCIITILKLMKSTLKVHNPRVIILLICINDVQGKELSF